MDCLGAAGQVAHYLDTEQSHIPELQREAIIAMIHEKEREYVERTRKRKFLEAEAARLFPSKAVKTSIMDMSESALANALAFQSAPPADPNARGHITKMAPEILIQILKGLHEVNSTPFESVCFGLTCRVAYNAFKAVYPGGVGLETTRTWSHPHVPGCMQSMRSSQPEVCDCWIPHSLATLFKMPNTFKHTDFANNYRLCINRGDRNVVFLNKAVYGETDDIAAIKIKEMNRRYGLFGHFKKFNQYVIKGSSCRLATNGEKTRGPSLIPTPSGKSYAEWSAEIVDAMKGDLKWWTCKEDWLGFWMAGFTKCRVYIHRENRKVLEECAAKHVWLEVSKFQRKIAESMIARYCEINKMGRN